MGDISKHFNRSEFACQCNCGFSTVDIELIRVLENLREFYEEPITITSGCRCVSHNHAVGGSANSKHREGIAVDIKVKDETPEEVYDYLDDKYNDKYGIGLYSGWVHIDTRPDKSRWRG